MEAVSALESWECWVRLRERREKLEKGFLSVSPLPMYFPLSASFQKRKKKKRKSHQIPNF